jgi:hypothetical protein
MPIPLLLLFNKLGLQGNDILLVCAVTFRALLGMATLAQEIFLGCVKRIFDLERGERID